MKKTFLAIVASFSASFSGLSATLGTTTGSDFSTATWTNGASTTVGSWFLIQGTGSSFAIGDSSQGGRPSIGASAFHIRPGAYATITGGVTNNNTDQGYAKAYLVLNGGALSLNQTLKFDVNFLWNNGTKGFALETAGGTTGLFGLQQNWSDPLQTFGSLAGVSTNVLSNAYQQAVSVEATQQTGALKITIKNNSSDIFSQTYTTVDSIAQIQFFAGNIDPTQIANTENQGIFINNISVIPEPSTPLLMGLGLAGLLALRKSRKA